MKILLIVPNFNSILFGSIMGKIFPNLVATQPLVLQQLAALTAKEHEIEFVYEAVGDKINYRKYYDLVGISCTTYDAFQSYEIADKFRAKGVPVILGGYHPSALPKDAKPHADAVVIGEAEYLWPKLLKDFKEKKLQDFYAQKDLVNPKHIPPARRDVGSKNIRSLAPTIQTSRGCINRCKFCSLGNVIEGPRFRPRPTKDVIDELKSISKKYLFISDASLTSYPKYTKSLFKEIKGLDKKFLAYGNINTLGEDDELLAITREAGCIAWHVGFESVSQKTIDNIGKKTNTVQKYKKYVKKIHDYGMNVMGSFIFGFDTDTVEIFDQTCEVINKYDIDTADFNILVPFPGTPLYNQLEMEGRIVTKDWRMYTGEHVVFKLKNMTEEEMMSGMNKVAKKYYLFTNFVNKSIKNKNIEFYSFMQFLWRYLAYRKMYKTKRRKNIDGN